MIRKTNNETKETLKREIQKKDFFYKIFCYVLIKIGFSNTNLQALEIRNKKYKRIIKKYKSIIKNIEYSSNEYQKEKNKIIWICWLQGIENAPEIVKCCINSVKRNCKDKEIRVITLKNLKNYIKLPNYIMQKYENGKISSAHLSDIIRTELLINYGGTWIDATTYLMDAIPEYVYKGNAFFYSFRDIADKTIIYNSWFIYAEKDNRLLKVVRDLLYTFWKKENYLSEYFLWHQFMKMATLKYPEDIDGIEYYSDEIAHMLQNNLLKKYDADYWEEIKKISPIQKITYKIDIEEKESKSFFYDYIIEYEKKFDY